MGAARAGSAARRLLQRDVTALVSWGTAAALAPRLRAGDLLLPGEIRCADGTSVAVSASWHERVQRQLAGTVSLCSDPLLELPEPVAAGAEKSELHRRTGAVAGDMESAAVARVAAGAGVPFLALRVVVDEATADLPRCLMAALGDDGRTSLVLLLAGLLRRPRELRPVISLAWGYQRALGSLRRSGRTAAAALAPGAAASC